MSLIVKGMKMPTNCALCDCSFGALCYVSPAEVNGYCPGRGRPDWCPLVELPEKHGDLIDRSALPKDRVEWEDIVYAEVVVEAEGD